MTLKQLLAVIQTFWTKPQLPGNVTAASLGFPCSWNISGFWRKTGINLPFLEWWTLISKATQEQLSFHPCAQIPAQIHSPQSLAGVRNPLGIIWMWEWLPKASVFVESSLDFLWVGGFFPVVSSFPSIGIIIVLSPDGPGSHCALLIMFWSHFSMDFKNFTRNS